MLPQRLSEAGVCQSICAPSCRMVLICKSGLSEPLGIGHAIVHCALCIVHCALCIVHCALCIVHSALCILHCALCIVHYALCIMHYALCIVHSALCIVHYALCIVHCALCIVHSALCIVHCALCIPYTLFTSSTPSMRDMCEKMSWNSSAEWTANEMRHSTMLSTVSVEICAIDSCRLLVIQSTRSMSRW